jgi:hypothetical protein
LFFVCLVSFFNCVELYLDDQIHSFGFFAGKRYETKTVLTARTGRIVHSDWLVRVRMCEPCCIATKAAIALYFKLIRIDGATIGKWDILKKDGFIVLTNHPGL